MIMQHIAKWHRKRQRKIDLRILWPQCKKLANSKDIARRAFYYHAMNDEAWFKDFTNEEIFKICKELE